MKPEQAIEILRDVAAQFRGTLKEHQTVQAALAVLDQSIQEPEPEPEKEPE